jgi:hypothetical protein
MVVAMSRRVWVVSALLGAAVAVGLLSYAWYSNTHNGAARLPSSWYLALCPMSASLIGTDNARPLLLAETYTIIIGSNALLYALVARAIVFMARRR